MSDNFHMLWVVVRMFLNNSSPLYFFLWLIDYDGIEIDKENVRNDTTLKICLREEKVQILLMSQLEA